tara:strand:+ start:104 stop:865 length:762 start_codon:yes stop_codon:yes gene_type:complete
MKKKILKVADFLSLIWLLIPWKIRRLLFTGFFILESRDKNSAKALSRIFLIKDKLEWIINERALNYGSGLHPKHRLTDYHNFFIERISNGQTVLDVGCGVGLVALNIASKLPNSDIIGIDINKENINIAKKLLRKKNLGNLKFILGDITKKENIKSDVVVLSNVLEHIHDRIGFLKNIYKMTGSNKFLIRVPLFERDWQIPLRKELGMYYFSDLDHKIEHTVDEFKKEIYQSDFLIKELITIWGEIWAVCIHE